ncbi:MAG: hypothetical protein IJU77_08700 [Butyrivibrio sp.]|nr:hypothetical protein [Butyrivibrio sp.]
MLKVVKKHFLRIIFVLLTVVSLWYWDGVMCIKNDDGIQQAKAMYYQPKDTVDVVMMGSSHIHYDIDTGILWKKYGISSFDYSAAEQPLWITYYYLREFCKYQNPKVVVLDLYSPALRKDDYQYEWALPNILGMRFSLNKLEMLNESLERDRISDYFPSFWVYHGRFNDLTAEDFIYPFKGQRELVNYKGYKPVFQVQPQTKPTIKQQGSGVLTIKSEIYLQKIIDYTKKNNIELFLVVTPYITNDDEELIYNRVKEIAQINNIEFNSTNYDYDKIGLDFEKDFMDNSHLNYTGAGKFTEYLGKELKSRFKLTDHRGDPAYDSWEVNYRDIAKYVKEATR